MQNKKDEITKNENNNNGSRVENLILILAILP